LSSKSASDAPNYEKPLRTKSSIEGIVSGSDQIESGITNANIGQTQAIVGQASTTNSDGQGQIGQGGQESQGNQDGQESQEIEERQTIPVNQDGQGIQPTGSENVS